MKDNNIFKATDKKRNAKDKAWYKEIMDLLDNKNGYFSEVISNRKKEMRINFDLMNGVLNQKDFEYVCKPYGDKVGESLIQLNNKDIVSNKINSIIGMEMKRPFVYNVVAVNPEATTRKEQKRFSLIKDFVVDKITAPIREQITIESQQQAQGRELTPEEINQIKQQIEEETAARTPKEVVKYMQREYQDPAEVLMSQLLEYLSIDLKSQSIFNEAFKYGMLSAEECIYIGETDKKLELISINPMRLDYSLQPDEYRIEKSEWVKYDHLMTPTQVVERFGTELSEKDIDDIYNYWYSNYSSDEDLFAIKERQDLYQSFNNQIVVTHFSWKALRKVGFLSYYDENGEEQMKLVSELYKLDKSIGDIDIEWEFLPETYEGYRIKVGRNIDVKLGPSIGQMKDIDTIRNCDHNYIGIVYNNMNTTPVSLMTRLKNYQYLYNIIWYRLETLLASDKGKKILMNIGAIPTSSGIDVAKWQHYFENTPYAFYNPQEEGTTFQDANTIAKVLDLSLASDIQKYMEIADFVDRAAASSVGITPEFMGQISPRSSVTNAQTNISQSSNILEPYFNLHSEFKKNVLQTLVDKACVYYSGKNSEKLIYVVDDISKQMLTVSSEILDANKYGIFISDSSKIEDVKTMIVQLAHAAMQNQTVDFSDTIAIMRQNDLNSAEEILKAGEVKKQQQIEKLQKQQASDAKELEAIKAQNLEKQHEMNKDLIVVKEEERRKTVLQEKILLGMSFNPDLDKNENNVNDFLEMNKEKLNGITEDSKLKLERDKFEYQKIKDEKDRNLEKEKVTNKKAIS